MVAATEEVVGLGAAVMEGFRRNLQEPSAYFYADDELLLSTQEIRLQQVFNILTELLTAWASAPIRPR